MPKMITETIHAVSVNDRDTDLFEGLWPLPRGVSYNAYVIRDEKIALIDTVKGQFGAEWLSNVRAVLSGRTPDYIIVNHMEPDHSGSLCEVMEAFPQATIVGNKKTTEFLKRFYGITERIKEVADGEKLSLGKHELTFFLTPMVHWPESMMTYESSERILFSNDAFGGFGAMEDGIFDDQVDLAQREDEILRYFSNIIGKYAAMAAKAIARLASFEIKVVAPSHGPVWRKDPKWIVERYRRWSAHEAEPGVVIAYASMYGNTERMMEAVAMGCSSVEGLPIRIHDVGRVHPSFVIRDMWRYQGIVLGAPTYDAGLFPPMEYLVRFLSAKKLSKRSLGIFSNASWAGGGMKVLREFAETGGWNLIEPFVDVRSAPTEEDIGQCSLLGQEMARRVKESF